MRSPKTYRPTAEQALSLPVTSNRLGCMRLVHAINDRLGNHGQTIRFIEPIEAEPTEPIRFAAPACRCARTRTKSNC